MTKTITVTLSDAAAGTWTTSVPGKLDLATGTYTGPRTVIVAIGARISEGRDYGQLADEIQPIIEQWVSRQANKHALLVDSMIQLVDPTGADLDGQPIVGGEVVCQFRLRDGAVDAQISRRPL